MSSSSDNSSCSSVTWGSDCRSVVRPPYLLLLRSSLYRPFLFHSIGLYPDVSITALIGKIYILYSSSLFLRIFPIKSFISLSRLFLSSFFIFNITAWKLEQYSAILMSPKLWIHWLYCCFLLSWYNSYRLSNPYSLQSPIICSLVSGTLQAWQFIYASSSRCLVVSVSLDPSHPVRSLKIYLISFTLCLLIFMYACTVCLKFYASYQ